MRSESAAPRPDHAARLPDAAPVARLVHVTTVPQSLGFLAGQTTYMRERGFEIAAISSPGPELGEFARRERVEGVGVEMPRRITPARDLAAVWRIYRELRRRRPHIVHSHTPKGGLLGTISAWLARVPVRIYHIRGLPFMTAAGPRRRLLRWTERLSCACATRVLCVSHSVAAVAVGEGLCGAAKIHSLLSGSGNGVDAEGRFDPDVRWHEGAELRVQLGISPTDVVIGFVGRLVRDKGVAELAGAWRVLRERHAGLRLLIVGDFEPQDPVPDEARAILRDDPRVHLAGWQRDTAAFYAAMDVVTLPSYREGLPNVPLEAAAMRIPVVATRVPGCTDAVADGTTGTLVPARDTGALTEALERYVVSPELRAHHGGAGRSRAMRDFRPVALWDAMHAEYLRLLAEGGVVTKSSIARGAGSAARAVAVPGASA